MDDSLSDWINTCRVPLDAAQQQVANRLSALAQRWGAYQAQPIWRKMFSAPPQGLYLYGGVGRGKTMLVDAFFQSLPTARKKRFHFHVFMQRTHDCLKTQDLPQVARQWAREAHLIFFDEFHITDIADAMILSRLFTHLWREGVIFVMTSNFAPQALYPQGLNRERLVPFLDALTVHQEVLEMGQGQDYRRGGAQKTSGYFWPLNDATQMQLELLYNQITQDFIVPGPPVVVGGRLVPIARAQGPVALCLFAALCQGAWGRDDYLALTQHYTTLILQGVPAFGSHNQDAARRFMTFVDIVYDAGTRLIVSAADLPDRLWPGAPGALFERTVSRLSQMTR